MLLGKGLLSRNFIVQKCTMTIKNLQSHIYLPPSLHRLPVWNYWVAEGFESRATMIKNILVLHQEEQLHQTKWMPYAH